VYALLGKGVKRIERDYKGEGADYVWNKEKERRKGI
jgi:hypothetical protein